MYAIIDLGSNTVRLNVYQYVDQKIQLVFSNKEFISLASYINPYQQLSEEGIQAALTIIKRFVQILDKLTIKDAYLIATAAIRNVSNRESVMEKIKRIVPFSVELLSEEQEALADLEGVLFNMPFDQGLVIDIGGGSSELVALDNKQVQFAKAIKLGSLSAYIDHVNGIIPSKKELKSIKKDVEDKLRALDLPKFNASILYGVGGTIRAARKLAISVLSLPEDQRELTLDIVRDLIAFLRLKEKATYVKTIQVIPERLPTIVPGLKILETIMKRFKKPLMVISDYGVREGYLLQKMNVIQPHHLPAPVIKKVKKEKVPTNDPKVPSTETKPVKKVKGHAKVTS